MNQHKYPLNQGGFWGGEFFLKIPRNLHKLFVGQKFRAHRLISQAVEAQIEADKVWWTRVQVLAIETKARTWQQMKWVGNGGYAVYMFFFHKTFESPQIFNIIMMSSVKKYMVVWAHHFEQFWDMTFSDLGHF